MSACRSGKPVGRIDGRLIGPAHGEPVG